MAINLAKPTPITYLLNVIGQMSAYSYMAFLIYKFAQPLDRELYLKLLSGTQLETRMTLESISPEMIVECESVAEEVES